MKQCSTCLAEKALEAFYAHPFGKNGRQGKCIECTKAAVKANRARRSEYYRSYDRLRAKDPKRVEARKSYALANPKARPEKDLLKKSARTAVGNALREGRLVACPECETCGAPCDTHGHHDDYTKPLQVLWLCTACHALVHRYWDALDRKGF